MQNFEAAAHSSDGNERASIDVAPPAPKLGSVKVLQTRDKYAAGFAYSASQRALMTQRPFSLQPN